MNLGYRRIETAVAAGLVCLALAVPTSAGAATSSYPPDADARGFGGGLAGWTASTSFDGTCLAPLLCPAATNSHQASDGADGGGFIRSAYQGVVGVMAVGGTTTAVFTSPVFTYRGADGDAATAINFEMDRRASVDQLLAASGNSATYSVRLVDVSTGGDAVTAIAPTTLAGANSWSDVPGASIDPDHLTSGHEYRILITSTYTTGTSILVGGSADYDNVALRATDGKSGDGGGTGGAGGGNGDGVGLTRERLSELVQAVSPSTAVLTAGGKRLLVRVKCPRKTNRNCRIALQGLLRKGKPATTKRTVKVRKGRTKLVRLRVKPKARSTVAKRKRLLVRQKVRAGKVSVTVFQSRRLIRR